MAENEHTVGAGSSRELVAAPAAGVVHRATFSYATAAQDRPAVLQQIDMTASPGELCCILGAVGAGKTSLLNGILGELVVEHPCDNWWPIPPWPERTPIQYTT